MNIPKRIAAVLINSLKGGVTPRLGLPYITVGRAAEIDTLLHDVEFASGGGAAFRFVVGRYGSGKSFLIQTIRNYAMDKNFVVADADLSPERRLWGNQGQGLATYRELIHNLATKTRPEGGALSLILDRWISAARNEAAGAKGLDPQDPALFPLIEQKIEALTEELNGMVYGFDFAKLLRRYFQAVTKGDHEAARLVLRWFRGEYASKAEVKAALGISTFVGDNDWYELVKLFAAFLKGAGYSGLLVLIDELVNIWKAPNPITRQYNYEKILTMYNDTLQGKARHLALIMGATPECLEDRRRGLFSYEALRSRLEEGCFSREKVRDIFAPIIRLLPLSNEELLVLAEKLAGIHAGLFGYENALSEQDLAAFIKRAFSRVGAQTHITPREIIRDFIELLDILWQHPEIQAADLLASESWPCSEKAGHEAENGFAEFKL